MSNNYGTSYNINQSGELYTLQDHSVKTGLAQYTSTRGTTVNAPVNQRNLKLFRNLDNELFFFVKNQDRKPVFLQNLTVNASLIHRETQSVIVSKRCTVIDFELGSIKLAIRSGDIANLSESYCDLVFTYTNDMGLVLPLFVDQNLRPNFTVEISNDASAVPLTTQTVSTFVTNGDYDYSGVINGPSWYNKPNGLITFAVYPDNFTGDFFMQGTTSMAPAEDDWFDIELQTQYYNFYFEQHTDIEPFSIVSNLRYLRAKIDNTGQGKIDKIVVRV